MQSGESDRKVQEILPKSGLVVSEKGQLTEVRRIQQWRVIQAAHH